MLNGYVVGARSCVRKTREIENRYERNNAEMDRHITDWS